MLPEIWNVHTLTIFIKRLIAFCVFLSIMMHFSKETLPHTFIFDKLKFVKKETTDNFCHICQWEKLFIQGLVIENLW
jgi:hypothetical protein